MEWNEMESVHNVKKKKIKKCHFCIWKKQQIIKQKTKN